MSVRVPKKVAEEAKELELNMSKLLKETLIEEIERIRYQDFIYNMEKSKKDLENISIKEITDEIRKTREER